MSDTIHLNAGTVASPMSSCGVMRGFNNKRGFAVILTKEVAHVTCEACLYREAWRVSPVHDSYAHLFPNTM